jgi:hypothetical protein
VITNLAARYHDPLSVGAGSALALWAVAALAVTGGRGLLRVLPMRLITRLAAAVMAAMAVFTMIGAIAGLCRARQLPTIYFCLRSYLPAAGRRVSRAPAGERPLESSTGPEAPPQGRSRDRVLLRRGQMLEGITLGWNVAGIAVLAFAALSARSVALAGFGLDSLIEIGASAVVLWELSGTGEDRQRRALRLIGGAFLALAAYLAVQSGVVLATGYRPGPSPLGIAWTAVTAAAMFALAAGKGSTGRALGNEVLATEARVTLVDGILAMAVLAGLVLNAAAGLWWADPLAALVIVCYAVREAREIFHPGLPGLPGRRGRPGRPAPSGTAEARDAP